MGKNKKQPEQRTNPANETQKLTGERKLSQGVNKRGGQSPK